MGCLLDALERACRVLGLEAAADGDDVFRHLVLARIIEPVSKLDSVRVLEEAGVAPVSYQTIERRLPTYAEEAWRQRLSRPVPRTPGSARPALCSMTCRPCTSRPIRATGFREPGFSKERRLDPQITIGLLTGQDGFPLMVSTFEGNKAETKTMLVISKFMTAHQLPDVTVVADEGMISEANQKAIEAAGLSFILGMKIPDVPCVVDHWRHEHPGEDLPDGHVFTQPWPAGPGSKRRDQQIYYQYKADRARRTLRGIDEQVAKAAKAVAGLPPVKRNRLSPWTARSRASTGSWRRRPEPWPGSRATSPTSPPAPTEPRSPRTSSSAPTAGSSKSSWSLRNWQKGGAARQGRLAGRSGSRPGHR
jgi:hypothetical protein